MFGSTCLHFFVCSIVLMMLLNLHDNLVNSSMAVFAALPRKLWGLCWKEMNFLFRGSVTLVAGDRATHTPALSFSSLFFPLQSGETVNKRRVGDVPACSRRLAQVHILFGFHPHRWRHRLQVEEEWGRRRVPTAGKNANRRGAESPVSRDPEAAASVEHEPFSCRSAEPGGSPWSYV